MTWDDVATIGLFVFWFGGIWALVKYLNWCLSPQMKGYDHMYYLAGDAKAPEQAPRNPLPNYIIHLVDLAKAGYHEEVSKEIIYLWGTEPEYPDSPYAHRSRK